MTDEITPELMLHAYASGIFPMAENRDDPDLFWVDPRRRGVFPLGGVHDKLARELRVLEVDVVEADRLHEFVAPVLVSDHHSPEFAPSVHHATGEIIVMRMAILA